MRLRLRESPSRPLAVGGRYRRAEQPNVPTLLTTCLTRASIVIKRLKAPESYRTQP